MLDGLAQMIGLFEDSEQVLKDLNKEVEDAEKQADQEGKDHEPE